MPSLCLFHFWSYTNFRLTLVVAVSDDGCHGIMKYRKVGFYDLEPGQTRWLWSGSFKNRPFFWYAEVIGNPDYKWGGNHNTHVPYQAFNRCWEETSTDGKFVGMRMSQGGSDDDYTQPITR